jgi:hypothetical protein
MAHFIEVSGKRKEKGDTKKVVTTQLSKKKGTGKTKRKRLEEIDDVPKKSPKRIIIAPDSSEVTPKRKKPTPEKVSSSERKRAKPQKSLYPHSKANAYNFPTGHAVAHLPSEPAVEFGDGWTTRTLMRPNPDGRKPSDT